MDGDDIAADKDWGGSGGKSSDSFIDRSKVRILMCDNDAKSSKEAFTLLCKCSYQVTSVRSARQVIDALNAEGPDIDIILSEVDLPMAKGLKMLKYIMRDKELRRIPVIMMSAQDEVSIVVKCLRLGAADYLVKPLRTNELLNLWTHMWRRRQMLGLLEKKIMNFDFDLVASDPSDANTNSTTLFSDDTDDKSKKNANPELCMLTHQEEEVNVVERQIMEEHSGFTGLQRSGKNTQSNSGITAAPVDPPPVVSLDYGPEVLGTSNRQTGQFSSCPKKSELRIGGSSAFFSYVKHSMPKSNTQVVVPAAETASLELRIKQRLETWSGQTCRDTINLEKHMGNGAQNHEKREVKENHSPGDDFPSSCSIRDSLSMDRSSTPPVLTESTHCSNSTKEDFSQAHVHLRNVSHHDVRAIHAHTAYPYYISGMMNQIMMPSSQMYQKNLQDLPAHAASTLLPQFGHVPQVPHVPGMASYPYYPVGICMQPGQMPGASPWPLYGSSTTAEEKLGKVGRREAALIKFRQKRKERCFDKKIRYVNRKRLAERRPRVRGQFVRKINGINVDLNGQPASLDYDVEEEEDEYEEDSGARDSFPEDEDDNAATDPSTFQS